MGSSDDKIRALAGSLSGLARRAVAEYTPIVDSLVGDRSVEVGDIERTLDGLLDFCFDPEALRLSRRLCRHYRGIDASATAAYVAAYRQLWGSDAEPQA